MSLTCWYKPITTVRMHSEGLFEARAASRLCGIYKRNRRPLSRARSSTPQYPQPFCPEFVLNDVYMFYNNLCFLCSLLFLLKLRFRLFFWVAGSVGFLQLRFDLREILVVSEYDATLLEVLRFVVVVDLESRKEYFVLVFGEGPLQSSLRTIGRGWVEGVSHLQFILSFLG